MNKKQLYSIYEVMGIPIAALRMSDAVQACVAFMQEPGVHLVATANAEMIMLAQQDHELAHVLRDAELVVPDGAGVLWAGEKLGFRFPERVTGADLAHELLLQSGAHDWPVYFLGGAPGVAEKAARRFSAQYGDFPVAGIHDGYFDDIEEARIIKQIRDSGARLLLVGMGVPKQEKWIYAHKQELGNLVAVGIGGVFDVMAGNLKRAPLWMQKHRLEWAYRLYLQPSRIGRMLAIPKFMVAVRKWKRETRG